MVAAPPSAGTSLPSISGQSVNTSCAFEARTYVPTSSSANVTPAVHVAARANARSPPTGRSAGSRRASTATTTTSAISASAVTKWAVTHHGSFSVSTTTPPRTACATTSGNAARAGTSTRASRDRPRQASRAVSPISTIARNATTRCENSMSECTAPAGNRRPGSHAGQVLHPRPDPVPRTSPPTVNSTTVVTAAARASFRNRVMGAEPMIEAARSVRSPRIPAVRPWRFPWGMA